MLLGTERGVEPLFRKGFRPIHGSVGTFSTTAESPIEPAIVVGPGTLLLEMRF